MDELPRPGTAVHLAVGGQTWRTELISAGPEGLVLSLGDLAPPELLSLEGGLHVNCRFHETQALCTFEGVLSGRSQAEGVERLHLGVAGSITRSQRRQHVRVSLKIPLQLRLPLRNDALTRARVGREFILDCWVQGVAVNISAGGFRVLLSLPRHHSPAQHKAAWVRMEFAGLRLRDRKLDFLRRDWSSDQNLLIYLFSDLSPREVEQIENFSLNWLHGNAEHREDT